MGEPVDLFDILANFSQRVVFYTLFSSLLYSLLILPISAAMAREDLQGNMFLADILVSTIFWAMIGIAFGARPRAMPYFERVLSVVVTTLCGAAGGWAIGQLRPGEQKKPVVATPLEAR